MRVPILGLESLRSEGSDTSDTLEGEVVYRMGGQFWPTRCHARLTGELLLIQRSGKQEAAVTLHGASVELRAQSTVCIAVPGSPLLALRLDNDQEAAKWHRALQDAAHRAKGFKDLMNGVVPLMLSPRSEAEWTEAEERMERMRSELAEKDQAHGNAEEACKAEAIARAQAEEHKKLAERDVELLTNQLEQTIAELSAAKTSAETQTQRIKELETRVKELQEELDAAQSKLQAAEERQKELETSVQTEQEQRVVAETDLRALKQKVELESAKMEQILAAKEMLEAKLLEGQDQMAALRSKFFAESEKLMKETDLRDKLEVTVARLEAQVEMTSQQGHLASEGKVQDLQRRHGASEQRLAAAEECRRAAELRASGAERRLHETEELLDKKTNELFALQRHIISGVGGAGASMVKELEELRRGKREAAARIQQLEEELANRAGAPETDAQLAAATVQKAEENRANAEARAAELERVVERLQAQVSSFAQVVKDRVPDEEAVEADADMAEQVEAVTDMETSAAAAAEQPEEKEVEVEATVPAAPQEQEVEVKANPPAEPQEKEVEVEATVPAAPQEQEVEVEANPPAEPQEKEVEVEATVPAAPQEQEVEVEANPPAEPQAVSEDTKAEVEAETPAEPQAEEVAETAREELDEAVSEDKKAEAEAETPADPQAEVEEVAETAREELDEAVGEDKKAEVEAEAPAEPQAEVEEAAETVREELDEAVGEDKKAEVEAQAPAEPQAEPTLQTQAKRMDSTVSEEASTAAGSPQATLERPSSDEVDFDAMCA